MASAGGVAPAPESRWALWDLGFRPFFLLAALFGAVSAVSWTLQFTGHLPFIYVHDPLWHGHEMIFGFTTAVITGFLLTAVRNWTGLETVRGPALAGLAALWLLGRLAVIGPWPLVAAAADCAFALALVAAVGMPLMRAKNTRNYFFTALLAALGALAAAAALSSANALPFPPQRALGLALGVVLLILVVMGGRVIPMFTNSGVPGAGAARHALIERLAPASIIALIACDLLSLPATPSAFAALLGALVHGARLCLWRTWRTVKVPLVWILHAGYAWLVVHLALRAAADFAWMAGSFAVHALTVGAIGGLTIGMMTRVARGHTGRSLVAGRSETMMFILVQLAAVARVFCAMHPPWYMPSIMLSGVLWGAAFVLYALRYWTVLTRPRVDGKFG